MKNVKSLALVVCAAALLAFAFAGCATLFKGTTEDVSMNSDPSGAEVYINGQYRGETPLTIELESKETYVIEFRKEGYEPRVVNLSNRVGAKWVVLDVLGGLVPVVIDAMTGAWYELDQETVNVQFPEQ